MHGNLPRLPIHTRLDGSAKEVGGAKIAGTALFVNRDMKIDAGLDGTLGLQSLIGRVTVIDYPGKRLCILDEAKVPDSLRTAPKWTSATLRDGKLFVPYVWEIKRPAGRMYLPVFGHVIRPRSVAMVNFYVWRYA